MDEQITTPEGAATTVDESTKPAPLRAPDGKFTSSTPPEGATTEAKVDTPEAPKDPTTEKPEGEEPKRNKVSSHDRINQLTAEKHSAMREAAALRRQLEALQKAPRPQVDPNDYEAQQRENVRGVFREEQAQQTVNQYEQAVQRARAAQVDTFYAKVEGVRERIPDIDRSIQTFSQLPVSDHAAEIIAESDVAAEIAHYLANNPREAFDIYQLSPAQQGRALARIEQRVSLPARRTSSAPPPTPMVTGAQATRQKTPAEESASEYVARRKAEWAKGAR